MNVLQCVILLVIVWVFLCVLFIIIFLTIIICVLKVKMFFITEKEKQFSRANKNIFREMIVHLVLAYEKILDDKLFESFKDLQHCLNMLDCTEMDDAVVEVTDVQKIDKNSNVHEHYFSTMKQRRNILMNNENNRSSQEPNDTTNYTMSVHDLNGSPTQTDTHKSAIVENGEEIPNSYNNYSKLNQAEDRMSALEYVVKSIVAHLAYFSGSYEPSYMLAKNLKNK